MVVVVVRLSLLPHHQQRRGSRSSRLYPSLSFLPPSFLRDYHIPSSGFSFTHSADYRPFIHSFQRALSQISVTSPPVLSLSPTQSILPVLLIAPCVRTFSIDEDCRENSLNLLVLDSIQLDEGKFIDNAIQKSTCN